MMIARMKTVGDVRVVLGAESDSQGQAPNNVRRVAPGKPNAMTLKL
jgi:hypothetical protein